MTVIAVRCGCRSSGIVAASREQLGGETRERAQSRPTGHRHDSRSVRPGSACRRVLGHRAAAKARQRRRWGAQREAAMLLEGAVGEHQQTPGRSTGAFEKRALFAPTVDHSLRRSRDGVGGRGMAPLASMNPVRQSPPRRARGRVAHRAADSSRYVTVAATAAPPAAIDARTAADVQNGHRGEGGGAEGCHNSDHAIARRAAGQCSAVVDGAGSGRRTGPVRRANMAGSRLCIGRSSDPSSFNRRGPAVCSRARIPSGVPVACYGGGSGELSSKPPSGPHVPAGSGAVVRTRRSLEESSSHAEAPARVRCSAIRCGSRVGPGEQVSHS